MLKKSLSYQNNDVIIFLGKKHPIFQDFELKETQVFKGRVLLHKDLSELSLREKIKGAISLFKKVQSLSYQSVLVVFDDLFSDNDKIQILKKLIIFNTPFDTHQEKKYEPISISVYDVSDTVIDNAMKRAEAVNFARTLVNEPSNVMTPTRLSEEAVGWAHKHDMDVSVYDEVEIKNLKMDAFLSVSKGSEAAPKFIVLRYLSNPNSESVYALVGKGVTYDSGGLAIKPTASMVSMHSDMGGSAAVLGAMGLLASQKAKVNAIAVVAACENMISGTSFKNGDIIGSMAGKSIEIINTDAEGRLTLADAIYYAHSKEKATHIVDIATLTGAAVVALGTQITAVVASDDTTYQALEYASEISADKIWRLPVDDELAKANHSNKADLKNATVGGAGTTTAALFLKEFTNDLPWTHLDIAGTAYNKAGDFDPEGASGVAVELLSDAVIKAFK